MLLLILFSPNILASGYHNSSCLAYSVEGLFRDSIAPLSTAPLWCLIGAFKKVYDCIYFLIFLGDHNDLSIRPDRARLSCRTVVGDFSLPVFTVGKELRSPRHTEGPTKH